MANHMAEVAKMLGVELGEEFEIGPYNAKYVLSDDGVYSVGGSKSVCTIALNNLLNGEWIIKRKPWKPKDDEKYWCVEPDGKITGYCWMNIAGGNACYKLGNCYRTREEAEANRDKWVAFYASDEVLEV